MMDRQEVYRQARAVQEQMDSKIERLRGRIKEARNG